MNSIQKRKYARAYRGLSEHYTEEEAKREIDAILREYDERCFIRFLDKEAEVHDSFRIRSRRVRHRVCAVITRTSLTGRSYDNLSAEWLLHNLAYRFRFRRSSARHAALDYSKDIRRSVYLVTRLLDDLGFE